MKFRSIIIIIALLVYPGLLPAPDLPPGGDSFAMVKKIRSEIINRDNTQFRLRYQKFKKIISRQESGSNWKEYNRFGYIGKYQFGQSALDATGFGHVTAESFRMNPGLFPEKDQERAMDILIRMNESALRDFIDRYVGMIFSDTIRITRMGILAAAHLAGPASVREYLDTFGRKDYRDRMGTHVSDYIYLFSR